MVHLLNNSFLPDYLFFSDPDEIPDPYKLKNFKLKKNTEYFCKNFIHINLIFIINMIRHGKELEYVNLGILNRLII